VSEPGDGGAGRGAASLRSVPVSGANPVACRPIVGHDVFHRHGDGCGHPAIAHGDHVDYLVDGTLHSPHGGHCDDHGAADLG
jgi:hypothetical protein